MHFRWYFLRAGLRQAIGAKLAAHEVPSQISGPVRHGIGDRVVLCEYFDEELNGKVGEVVSIKQSGRFGVRLQDGSERAVRPQNLRSMG